MISSFYRGDTKRYKLAFVQDGVPVDITGWVIWFTLKNSVDDPDSAAALQVTTGELAGADAVAGLAYITLTSDVTDGLEVKQYHYDFQRVIAGTPPNVQTLDAGHVRVKADITRSVTA